MISETPGPGDHQACPGPPPSLGPADLFPLASSAMLEMAEDYVLLGRVRRPRRRGCRLAAEVEGSEDVYPCRVDVAPADEGIRLAPWCACPSQRRFCKHVLALLGLWARAPEQFVAVDQLERALATRAAPLVAARFADVAMGGRDPLECMQAAAQPLHYDALPPGRCLEEWEAFRSAAEESGRWPEAALALGVRIAGAPAGMPADRGAPAAVASRQLAWWLTHMVGTLPPAGLLPWLQHLFRRLEAAAAAGDGPALAPELGVWLARLAAALPAERSAEGGWLARFAAATPALGPVFEAETERQLWAAEVSLRLAVAPAVPSAGGEGVPARCRALLEAMAGERAAARPLPWQPQMTP